MITLVLAITAIVFLYFYFKKVYSYFEEIGVPGPKPVPFLGTYFAENQLNGKEIELKFFKQYGSYFGTYAGTLPVFNTCDPDHIKQILNDVNSFQHFGLFWINDDYLHDSVFFQNGAKWKEHRKAMTGHFTSRKLKSLINHFEVVSANFLNNIEFLRKNNNSDKINIKEMSKFFTVDMISKYVFAIDIDSFKQHRKDSEFAKQALKIGDINLGHIILSNFLPLSIAKSIGLNIFNVDPINKLGRLFSQIIKQRDPFSRYEDLTEMLQNLVNENKVEMTENQMIANALTAFLAGTDTTANAISKIFYYLMEYPHYKDKLYEELKKEFDNEEISYEKLMENEYLDAMINESLRLGQSLLSLDKVAAKDIVLEKGNIKLKKGTTIFLIAYLSHMNPEYFPNPDLFDPNRFLDKSPSNPNVINNYTFYPFSSGGRQCVGMRLAQLLLKYFVAKVLLNYDVYKPEDFKLEEVSRRRFCFPLHMYVCFKKRV